MVDIDPLVRALHQLRTELHHRSVQTARAHYDDLYALGRAQGFLDGVEFAIHLVEGKVEEADN